MKTSEVMIYEGNEIEFSFGEKNGMMVNATEMAKIFGKQVCAKRKHTRIHS